MSSPEHADEPDLEAPRKSGYPKSFEKWGIDVVRSGYTLIPNHLININLYLSSRSKLTPTELLVVIIILSNWWNPSRYPAASKKYIGERCDMSERQVQRILRKLEKKGVLTRFNDLRRQTGGASKFDIRPLLETIRDITHVYQYRKDKRAPIQLEFDFPGDPVMQAEMHPVEDQDIPF